MEETKLKTAEEIRAEIFEAVTEMANTKPKWILWTNVDWLNWSFKIKKDIEALTDTRHAGDVPDEIRMIEMAHKLLAKAKTFEDTTNDYCEGLFIGFQECYKWMKQ